MPRPRQTATEVLTRWADTVQAVDRAVPQVAQEWHNDFLDEGPPIPAPPNVANPTIRVHTPRSIQLSGKGVHKSSAELEGMLVRELFKLRPPATVKPADLDAYFEAQKKLGRITHPIRYEFPDGKSLVGIEVEVENVLAVDPNVLLRCWRIELDGSLRNEGREFKSIPIPIQYVEPALTCLFNGINEDVDFSTRTSIHIHQDVRRLTIEQLLTLIVTYSVIEPLFFRYVAHDRKKSIYCVPITETTYLSDLQYDVNKLSQLFGLGPPGIEQRWNKYLALNVIPVGTFGTVEYRHMAGTRDLAKILGWVDLISRLKVWAYRNDFDYVVRMIAALNTNSQYNRFVEDVFQDAVIYLDRSNLVADMEPNVTLVKHSALANEFVQTINQRLRQSQEELYRSPFGQKLDIIHPYRLSPEKLEVFNRLMLAYFPGEDPVRVYQLMSSDPSAYVNHVAHRDAADGRALRAIFAD